MKKIPVKKINIEISKDEADYILGVLQADKIKIDSLEPNSNMRKVIAKPIKAIASLEKKLIPVEPFTDAYSL